MDSPQKGPGTSDSDGSGDWVRWTGVGFEFAAAVLLFFWLGSRLDATWGTDPWMQVAGAFLGIVVGTYLLIRQAVGSKKTGGPPRGKGDE